MQKYESNSQQKKTPIFNHIQRNTCIPYHHLPTQLITFRSAIEQYLPVSKAMENSPIKIHLSIMQFLRLNERMALYMCKYLALTIAMYVYYVCAVFSLPHSSSLVHSLSLSSCVHCAFVCFILYFYIQMYNVQCILPYIYIHSVLQSFIVLGYSKICSRKIVSRALYEPKFQHIV